MKKSFKNTMFFLTLSLLSFSKHMIAMADIAGLFESLTGCDTNIADNLNIKVQRQIEINKNWLSKNINEISNLEKIKGKLKNTNSCIDLSISNFSRYNTFYRLKTVAKIAKKAVSEQLDIITQIQELDEETTAQLTNLAEYDPDSSENPTISDETEINLFKNILFEKSEEIRSGDQSITYKFNNARISEEMITAAGDGFTKYLNKTYQGKEKFVWENVRQTILDNQTAIGNASGSELVCNLGQFARAIVEKVTGLFSRNKWKLKSTGESSSTDTNRSETDATRDEDSSGNIKEVHGITTWPIKRKVAVYGGISLVLAAAALIVANRYDVQGTQWLDPAIDSAKGFGKSALDKTGEVAEVIAAIGKSALDKTANIGKSALDKTGEVAEVIAAIGKSALDKTANIGKSALDKTGEVAEVIAAIGKSALDKTANIGKSALDKTGGAARAVWTWVGEKLSSCEDGQQYFANTNNGQVEYYTQDGQCFENPRIDLTNNTSIGKSALAKTGDDARAICRTCDNTQSVESFGGQILDGAETSNGVSMKTWIISPAYAIFKLLKQ